MEPTPEPRAKLYINTGLVTDKSDIYNILRPLLKQTVTYSYYRGNQVTSSGTGWVERLVVDHPEIASYFTPLSICLNLDSFGTTVSAGAGTSTSDGQWRNKLSVEQTLVGPLNVTTSVEDAGTAAPKKSITAGFKRVW